MADVRRAIHLRTGPRAGAELVDAWLSKHGAESAAFDDAYACCAHLLTRYAQVPDLALVGADWLQPDELAIIAYLRQTWPRCAIILYGDADVPAGGVAPSTTNCRGRAALATLLAAGPDELISRLAGPPHPPVRAAPTSPSSAPRAEA